MQQEDLKQIAELFDTKLKENNKILSEDIVQEIGSIVNTAFSEFESRVNEKFAAIDQRFDAVEKDLSLKPSISQFQHWADENLAPTQLDVDRLKYIVRKEMKELPSQLEISQTLISEGLV